MAATKPITLRLDPADYDRLAAQASRLGIPPAVLARAYIRGHLNGTGNQGPSGVQQALDALDQLEALAAGLPEADISDILEESRRELEERPHFR
jgi:hypothetical protein